MQLQERVITRLVQDSLLAMSVVAKLHVAGKDRIAANKMLKVCRLARCAASCRLSCGMAVLLLVMCHALKRAMRCVLQCGRHVGQSIHLGLLDLVPAARFFLQGGRATAPLQSEHRVFFWNLAHELRLALLAGQ